VSANQLAVGGRLVDLRTPRATYDELYLPVHGAHQADNAVLALAAVEAFFDRPLDDEVVAEAFGQLRLPGRFEVVGRNPLVVLDGAHNPDGAGALARTLADFNVDRRVFVVGLLGGRDVDEMVRAFGLSPGDLVVACAPDNPRAIASSEIADAVERLGVSVDIVDDPVDAVDTALAFAGEEDGVIVTGSLYVVGAARTRFDDLDEVGERGPMSDGDEHDDPDSDDTRYDRGVPGDRRAGRDIDDDIDDDTDDDVDPSWLDG
jgi:dihydrofolate synthase/folylpolyglutamate synthase